MVTLKQDSGGSATESLRISQTDLRRETVVNTCFVDSVCLLTGLQQALADTVQLDGNVTSKFVRPAVLLYNRVPYLNLMLCCPSQIS